MVRQVRDVTGRFNERPHYSPEALDQACDQLISSFLARYRKPGRVAYPITTDELTVLLEEHVKSLDVYADLSEFGPAVQGVTRISIRGQRPVVEISVDLQQPHRENRLRTTFTHELAHVHLHNYLFGLEGVHQSLCCNNHAMIHAPVSDWMEWQAGYSSGAMLMPARQLRQSVRVGRAELKVWLGVDLPVESDEAAALIAHVANSFQVSHAAARVRLLQKGHLLG